MSFSKELPKNKKIVVFSPHPDDDVISMGATIIKLIKNKNKVSCVYLTPSPKGVLGDILVEEKIKIRENEAIEACKIIGSKPIFSYLARNEEKIDLSNDNINKILNVLKTERPDIVALNHKEDMHPTHRMCSRLILKALEKFHVVKKWFWEEWTPIQNPNCFIFFDENIMNVKIKAIRAHKSQIKRARFDLATKSLNLYRGIMGGEITRGFGSSSEKINYAEVFYIE